MLKMPKDVYIGIKDKNEKPILRGSKIIGQRIVRDLNGKPEVVGFEGVVSYQSSFARFIIIVDDGLNDSLSFGFRDGEVALRSLEVVD